MKKILFVCPYSKSIGTGHLMRSIFLAEKFKKYNCESIFYSKSEDKEKNFILRDLGYCTSDKISNNQDLTVIDDYSISDTQEALFSGKIMVIDDLANRAHKCDYLLDHTYRNSQDINPYQHLIVDHKNTKFFLGIEYCFIRDEFFFIRNKKIAPKSGKCFVFFSAADCRGMTEFALEALSDFDLEVLVAIGYINPSRNKIEKFCEQNNLKLLINSKSIAQEMADADFCIGSFGTHSYERLFLAKPALGITIADNQLEVGSGISNAGYAINLGWHETVTREKFIDGINEIIATAGSMRQKILNEISEQISSKTDEAIEYIVSTI